MALNHNFLIKHTLSVIRLNLAIDRFMWLQLQSAVCIHVKFSCGRCHRRPHNQIFVASRPHDPYGIGAYDDSALFTVVTCMTDLIIINVC